MKQWLDSPEGVATAASCRKKKKKDPNFTEAEKRYDRFHTDIKSRHDQKTKAANAAQAAKKAEEQAGAAGKTDEE
jgi:hypothetical protein